MIPHPTLHWNEILAAYADGEFEGRDDLALLKQRVEHWLAKHPDAAQELAQIRQLKSAWQQTTPAEPDAKAWQRILQTIIEAPAKPAPRRRSWRRTAGIAAAVAACVLIGVAMWRPRPQGPVGPAPVPVEAEEPFSVAAAHEVEILRVEGADTQTLVVGALPLQGPLELAGPGDVTVTSVQPAARDNMMPEVRTQGPGRPMIWARLDTD